MPQPQFLDEHHVRCKHLRVHEEGGCGLRGEEGSLGKRGRSRDGEESREGEGRGEGEGRRPECGVCFERPTGRKRYGLLINCDRKFVCFFVRGW